MYTKWKMKREEREANGNYYCQLTNNELGSDFRLYFFALCATICSLHIYNVENNYLCWKHFALQSIRTTLHGCAFISFILLFKSCVNIDDSRIGMKN